MNGPTKFGAIIERVTAWVKANQGRSVYTILMIITDGSIHDMVQTKRLIVQASSLPLSIIIIGVGEAEFALMNELDGDKTPLTDDLGNGTSRDIV